MPKKGSGKKSTNKKRSAETPTPMPSLVFQDVRFEHSEHPDSEDLTTIKSIRPTFAPHPRQHWLWVGVISLSATIFIFWAWSFSSRLTALSWGNTPEQQLLAKNKSNWDNVFSATKKQEEEKKAQAKQELKQIIGQLLSTASASTTTTTTSASTTTLPNNL